MANRFNKQRPIFLPIYVDKDKKQTFASHRYEVVEVEDEKGEKKKELKVVQNDPAYDRHGDPYIKPMNHEAWRVRNKEKRLYERKYGPKPISTKIEDKPFEIQAEVKKPE